MLGTSKKLSSDKKHKSKSQKNEKKIDRTVNNTNDIYFCKKRNKHF